MRNSIIVFLFITFVFILSMKVPVKSETFKTCLFTEEIERTRFSILRGSKSEYDEVKPVLPEADETCSDLMGWDGSRSKKLYLL